MNKLLAREAQGNGLRSPPQGGPTAARGSDGVPARVAITMTAQAASFVTAEKALTAALKDAAQQLLAQKKLGAASADGSRAPAILMELRSREDTLINLVQTHEAEEESVRERVAGVEEQLRMLKYQRSRLRRDIAKCTEGGAPTEDINLFQPQVEPQPGESAHQLTLRRLGVEREERAKLSARRDALAARREALAAATETANERKAAVDEQLGAVVSAAAAEALATPGAAPSPVHSRRPSQEEVSPASTGGGGAYPLSLCLVLKAGGGGKKEATITFKYHAGLELLTASASPAKADAALQKLSSLLPGSTANGEKDDGSAYPDLCACVRGRRVDAASVAELLPQRPYKWLQWLGGLGPLLNSPPQPSQLVLDTLVREIGKAV